MPPTKLSVSLRPVVSAATTDNPPILSVNLRTSRVVPRMGVTIDAGRFAIYHDRLKKKKIWRLTRKLKRLLYLALGSPEMAILMPE